jgi:hypothetical protein
MKKYREKRGPMSRLPDDEAYWVALTDRLVTDAAGTLSAYRSAGTRWWHRPAQFAAPLAIGAVAAVIAALLWLPEVPGNSAEVTAPAALLGSAPNDPLAVLFVTSAVAPTMATVLATSTSERAR